MALTFLPGSLVIESDASILDLPAFHAALRDWEDSAEAAIYPVTHTWKAVDLGSGASFYALALVNGWRLRFPTPGNYTITGNLGGEIIPVAGVYVERKTSAAFATTAVGGSGPSASDIAQAVWQRAIESGLSAEAILRVSLAALAGRSTGTGTDTEVYLGRDGSTARIQATFDAAGNRTSVTLNGA